MMDEENFFKALEKGDIEQARRLLGKMKPGLTRTRTLYLDGILLEANDELEEALKKFNMALVLHLSDPSIWLAKANVLKELGKLEMARRAVDRACRLSSGNPAAHLLYGEILYRMKDYTGASRQIDTALDLAPGDAEVLTLKGILVSILGQDYREALKYFDSALGSDDGYNKAWTNRGIALRQIGDKDGALYSFQKALILDEGDKVARKMLEKMGAEKYIVRSSEKKKKRSLKTPRYFAETSSSISRRRERTFKRTRAPHEEEDEEKDEWEELEDEERPEEYVGEEEALDEEEEEEGFDEEELEDEGEPGEYVGEEDDLDEEEEEEEFDEEEFEEEDELDEFRGEMEAPGSDNLAEPSGPEVKETPPLKKGSGEPKPERKGDKPGKKLNLDCPRCHGSFDIMVRGRTRFKCPSCGLSGEID